MPLSGRGFGVRIDLVLEVIDARSVRQECQRSDQVHAAEAVGGLLAHQLTNSGVRQEFEPHRVDLGRLVRGPKVVDAGQVAALPVLKGVAHLVREDAYIVVCAVEVGEDKGHARGRNDVQNPPPALPGRFFRSMNPPLRIER